MTKQLFQLQKNFKVQIAAFVLMNNHFHLLLLSPEEDIDWVMFYFMKDTTKLFQKYTGRINRIYGGRYKGCLIEDQHYLLNTYKYIYQNPVRANLCELAEEYPYSTLNSSSKIPFKVEAIVPLSIQSHNRILECRWINESFSTAENKSIKSGLSKTKFKYRLDRKSRLDVAPKIQVSFW